ncbi:MAG: hypothetical protein H3Z54_09585 [archaeon]|nr:hypothetical protein [archaeon]
MVEKSKWNKVNIPQEMLDLVDKYLNTDIAKQKGLKSRSDVAILAFREFLEEEGMYAPKKMSSEKKIKKVTCANCGELTLEGNRYCPECSRIIEGALKLYHERASRT